MVSNAVKKMREAGKAHLAKTKSSGGSSPGLTKEEIFEVEKALEGAKSQRSIEEQRAELARATSRLGGRATTITTTEIRAAAAKAQKAAEEQRIREAKDFAEKTRIAKEIVMSRQGRAEFKRILDARSNLIKRGIQERTVQSINQAGDKLKVSQWRDRAGNRIQRIVNQSKGITSYASFAKGRKTGAVAMGTTPTTKEIPSVLAKDIKVVASEVTGKKLVLLRDGRKFRINESGRSVIGAGVAGNKLTFKDGKLIQVNDRWVDGRDVFVKPTPTVTKVEKLKDVKKINLSETKKLVFKIMTGKKLTSEEAVSFYKKYDNINMKNAKALTIAGPITGTFIPGGQIPGMAMWALGEFAGKRAKAVKSNEKLTWKEVRNIGKDAAIMGALFGAATKILKVGGNIISKRVILGAALKNIESNAARAALNHGGVLIKFIGYSGKNFITTYFMKDMLGNIFDVTAEVKNGNFNSAMRKAIETGGAVGGYIGGSKITGGVIKGGLFASGKLKYTRPELKEMPRIPQDVMARQLLSEGKIILTRRGVYETGKGLSPRKDAWKDSIVKGTPTKSVFWRFEKTLSKKDEAISQLPLFTKQGSAYLKMFKANWKKNVGMSRVKRYLKTTAETPLVEDVLIRRIIHLKNIKNLKLRKQIIREYATKGKLSKATQEKVLKNNFPISDKNREFGFHDENEFVTRTGFKFKGRTDISWTYDPKLKEYIPVVQNLKDAGRIKNFLSFLNKKKIITRTDAQFIKDNYAIKKKFGLKAILPKGHSVKHMKQVQDNIIKIMNKYPEFNSYWKKRYGSIAKAKIAMKEAMWHDIGKAEESSLAFGTAHGEKVWNVWKAGLLPKDIKLTKPVALAIRKHETLDPRKLWYKVQNKLKLISPEEKIVATADRLDLARYNIKIDLARLPLKDVIKRLGIKVKFVDYPSKFSKIITKIKLDKGVTKADIKKLLAYARVQAKRDITKIVRKIRTFKTKKWKSYTSTKSKNSYRAGWVAGRKAGLKAPSNYNAKYKGNQPAYAFGYKDGYDGRYRINYKTGDYKRLKPRPIPRKLGRPPKRPTPRKPRRPAKRPPKRPTPRKPRRPAKRPPKRPPKRPVPRRPGRPPIKTAKKPPIMFTIPKNFKRKRLTKKQPSYLVVMRRRGKLVRLAAKPLILKDAKDYLAYRLDRGLSRSAWFEPVGMTKETVGLPISMRGYFSKIRKKLRPYKIRLGVKKAIRHGYIEKKKFVGDTKSEILALRKARAKAMVKKKRRVITSNLRRKSKRKIIKRTPTKKLKKKATLKRRPKRVSTKPKSQKKKRPVKRKPKKILKRKSIKRKSPVKRKISKKKSPIRRKKKKK